MEIRKRFHFEAAHHLPYHQGKCFRRHGHSYVLEVAVAGPIKTSGPETGMVIDFDAIGAVVIPTVIARLDHHDLNDLIENPTAENIVNWVWHQLVPKLSGIREVVLWETASAAAIVRAADAAD